jgi:hypothetical protein
MNDVMIVTALKAGHAEVFKQLAPRGYTFKGSADLSYCTGLTSVAGVTFNGNAYLRGCRPEVIAEAKAKGVRVYE